MHIYLMHENDYIQTLYNSEKKCYKSAVVFSYKKKWKKKRLHLNYKLLNKDFKKLKQRVKIKLNVYTGSSN